MAKLVSNRGRVYSFESQLDKVSYLSMNMIANDLGNIFPMHMVVSNASGYIAMEMAQHAQRIKYESPYCESNQTKYLKSHNYGGFSINDLRATTDSKTKHMVRQITLDELYEVNAIECPQFMKLDIGQCSNAVVV